MKRYLLWIAELFIWLLILFSVSGVIMLTKYNYKKNFNTYQIFLPDVDGLISGSPVKLMGIQIGYISQIDIVGEDVYVKFIITEPNIKVPEGSRVTVEFSGLGGSKSLELYPPTSSKSTYGKLLIPQSPKRIHDSLGLLNDMFDNVIELTYDLSHFMKQVGIIKSKAAPKNPDSPNSIEGFLDYSNDWLDNTQKQVDKFNNKLNGKSKKITKEVNHE